jgi:acyl carrier protein
MVFDKVKAIIADQLGIGEDEVTLEKSFRDDLDADSLSLFQIVNDIEDEFDIKIDDIENINTVGDAVKAIEALKK